MKIIISILVFTFAYSAAIANPDSERAVVNAEKSLKSANKALKNSLTTYRARALPESRASIAADQNLWRQQVEKDCEPDSEGDSKSGTGAEFEYAQIVQCQADAAMIRAKKLGAIHLLQ